MRLNEYYKTQQHTFSFEFFPPKNEEGEKNLFNSVDLLKPLAPSFVSVTYGAMGTTRRSTLQVINRIKKEHGLEMAAHIAGVGHSKEEIEALLQEILDSGIENIVVLRGDAPQDRTHYDSTKDGFRYASELVRFIRKCPRFSKAFSIAVGGYPEGHVECKDKAQDLEYLKIKVDAGSDIVITQLFFDNRFYFDFVERARKMGIRVPIVPGIMPVTHGLQIKRFASMCGASIPKVIERGIERFGDDQRAIENFGIEYATEQCEKLLKNGAPGLHFYTLNKSRAAREIYHNLHLGIK